MRDNLYDTHFHLDLFELNHEIIKSIINARIYTIAVTNLPILFLKLEKKIDSKYIRPALGLHPELLKEYNKYIPEMWELLPRVKYIGEVGLDFKSGCENKKQQLDFFIELIDRCNTLGDKILSIHSRNSAKEVLEVLGDNFNGIPILHWYSGDMKNLKKAVNKGCYFSINYSMTKTKNGMKIINEIPNDRLLLESDGPFVLVNKNPFTPLDMHIIVREIADIKNVHYDEMKNVLWNNFTSILK